MRQKKQVMRQSVVLSVEDYEALKKIAANEGVSASELMRKYMIQGMNVDKTKNDMDFIRSQIHAELENVMKPKVERIIKLLMRTGIMSTSFCFFTLKLIDAIIPPDADGKRSYEELLNEAKKDSAAYLYISDAHLETVFREFEKNNR